MDETISTFVFYKTLNIDIFSVLGVEIMTKIEEIDSVAVLVQGVDLSVDHDLHQRGSFFSRLILFSKKLCLALSCSHD